MKRKRKDWISSYLDYTQHSEAPEKFHFWAAVSTIAGALRRKVFIDMGYFEWTPNFFIVFVAKPGIATKSTTAGVGMDLLKEFDFINFGPATGTWQGLINKMVGLCEEVPMPDGSYLPMTCVTVAASEFGSFLNPKDREQVDILVDLWDGKKGAWSKLTKHDDEEVIQNPWINLIACTTPSWIAENLSDYFHGGGMSSRTIFVYAKEKKQLVAYPKLHMPKDAAQQKESLVHDLAIIASLAGEYELTPTAIKWGTAWYERLYTEKPEHLSSDKFAGYLSRKQTHLHKLAMVLAASRRNELVITDDDLIRADQELYNIEAEMPSVFSGMNQEKEMNILEDVIAKIKESNGITQKNLYSHFMRIISYDSFEKLMRSLTGSGSIELIQSGPVVKIYWKESKV